jgi:hypothetical protein
LTQDSPKNLHENCIKGRINAKGSRGGGGGGFEKKNKKVFRKNAKTKSQKLFKHPLTLETHLHNKHFCLTCPKKRTKEANPNKIFLIPSKGQQELTRREKPKGILDND